MIKEEIIIIGAGPCGIAAALACQKIGINPLIIEKGNVVDAIYHYPTHQTFFSTSEKLEIGNIPFISENYKPKRNQALVYYRDVVKRENVRVNAFEEVTSVSKEGSHFKVVSNKGVYEATYVIVATGYYGYPNLLNVPGEDLDKVSHYFKEGHPYFDQDVVVIGGKNSAVDATIELVKAGARVTVLYRGHDYSESIKPWILPEFQSLVKHGKVKLEFGAEVKEITKEEVTYHVDHEVKTIKNDFVFAMIGYHPNHEFIKDMGVSIDEESGCPSFNDKTMETNIENIFIAGVIAAGNDANDIFIENGRFHGEQIAMSIKDKEAIHKL